jgi:universal stress protein E
MRDRIHCHALCGSPQAAVQAVVAREKPDLVVIGATRHGRIGQAILGTTAQRVLRAARVPVLVLRGTLPARLKRVLLTTDLSRFSAGIHEQGLDVVESLFGDPEEIRSLLVLPYGTEFVPVLSPGRLRESGGAEIARFLAERRPRTRECEGVVRLGEPASGIEAECHAWKPDLLVLGTHGRSTAERWVLGSVAEAALRSSGINVLVLPARGPEEPQLDDDAARADHPLAGTSLSGTPDGISDLPPSGPSGGPAGSTAGSRPPPSP